VAAAPDPREVLRGFLADAASSFAIGVPAAVAEFMRAPAEPAEIAETGTDGLSLVTPRGGLRLAPHAAMRPLAWEAPSRRPERWRHGVVFLLPEAEAGPESGMGGRRVLSALGRDAAALTATDRAAELFDLGVGAPHVEFCVRTRDRALAARLRAHCGLALADWPGELTAALLAAGPDRVVASRLGRIEVRGAIPRAHTPLGPHTHLFPNQLAAGAADKPGDPDDPADPEMAAPAGWRPCLALYPPHPQCDLAGAAIPFARGRHAAFQALLAAWGAPDYLAAKARALEALRSDLNAGRAAAGAGARAGQAKTRIAARAEEVAARQWRAGAYG
jgi:hypothetical protein